MTEPGDHSASDALSCSQCGSTRLFIQGHALWTSRCLDCGFTSAGTASFAVPIEVEKDLRVIFQLTSAKQIPTIRAIATELAHLSTTELLHQVRTDGMRVIIPFSSTWRAQEYVAQAKAKGIEAQIQEITTD